MTSTILANYFMNQYEAARNKYTLDQLNQVIMNVMKDIYNLTPQAFAELQQVGPDYAAAQAFGHAHRDPNFIQRFIQAIDPTIAQRIIAKAPSVVQPALQYIHDSKSSHVTVPAIAGITAYLLYTMVKDHVKATENAPEFREKLLTPKELRMKYDTLVQSFPFTDPKNKPLYDENRKLEERQRQAWKYRNELVEQINKLNFSNPIDRKRIEIYNDALKGRDDTAHANITKTLENVPVLKDPHWTDMVPQPVIDAYEFLSSAPQAPKIEPLFGIDPKNLPTSEAVNKIVEPPKEEPKESVSGTGINWDSFLDNVKVREIKGGSECGGKAKSCNKSKWTEHVKKYAKEHNKTFFESLKLAKKTYKK